MDLPVLSSLLTPLGRARLHALAPAPAQPVLALGDPQIDACLPGGGLPLGNLHEIGGPGPEAETAAVMAAFAARLLAGLPDRRPLFWIAPCCDLYAPGLAACGLDPGRVIMVRTSNDTETLAAMETALRAGAVAAVLGEVGRLDPLPARRLQLACRKRGTTGFVLRRWPHGRRAAGARATAAVTRWEVAPAPSEAAFREPGPPRWRVALLHARGGQEGAWIIEMGEATGHDAPHPFRVVTELAGATPAAERHRLAG